MKSPAVLQAPTHWRGTGRVESGHGAAPRARASLTAPNAMSSSTSWRYRSPMSSTKLCPDSSWTKPSCGIAPVAACHHVEALLPHARVELATAPGGHLGVLTGRAARGTTWTLLDRFLDRPTPAKRRAKRAKPRARAA